jgi:SAM-dependent methyltransferase
MADPAFDSTAYWTRRYLKGSNSGAGSYGRLAEFKAAFLNNFLTVHRIETLFDLGCGDGNQLSKIDPRNYVGFDISDNALARCRKRFADMSQFRFMQIADIDTIEQKSDLSISMDVVFHLIEDEIFSKYMERLMDSSSKYIILYASDWEGAAPAPHVKHRWFSRWIALHRPEWIVTSRMANPFPFDSLDPDNSSFADFCVCTHRDLL